MKYMIPIFITFLLSACGGGDTNTSDTMKTTNQIPTAVSQDIILNEDNTTTIILRGNDPDGDNLTYTIITPPIHGSFDGSIYRPDLNYFGTDTLTFKVNDGHIDSNIATVTIIVNPRNDLPIINTPTNYNIIEGDSINPVVVSDSTIKSSVWIEDGEVITFPKNDFSVGVHTLLLKITDDQDSIVTQTITINVSAYENTEEKTTKKVTLTIDNYKLYLDLLIEAGEFDRLYPSIYTSISLNTELKAKTMNIIRNGFNSGTMNIKGRSENTEVESTLDLTWDKYDHWDHYDRWYSYADGDSNILDGNGSVYYELDSEYFWTHIKLSLNDMTIQNKDDGTNTIFAGSIEQTTWNGGHYWSSKINLSKETNTTKYYWKNFEVKRSSINLGELYIGMIQSDELGYVDVTHENESDSVNGEIPFLGGTIVIEGNNSKMLLTPADYKGFNVSLFTEGNYIAEITEYIEVESRKNRTYYYVSD